MHVEFQGKAFTARIVEPDNPNNEALKVNYFNKTRNINGSVTALTTDRLARLLEVQSQCCRIGGGQDELEPRA